MTAQRNVVVTGSGSGMGAAIADLMRGTGQRVVGVDLRGAEVIADLSAPAGRAAAVAQVMELCDGTVDALVACAGLRDASATTVSVNYFGSIELVCALRQALSASAAPRVVLTSSLASVLPCDPAIVEACLAGDEASARAAAEASTPDDGGRPRVYSSSKTAVSRWVRRTAATPEYAGAGILLNAVAPGTVATPMVADVLASEEARAAWLAFLPNAQSRFPVAAEAAELFCWLASPENSLLIGQTVFADLGSELLIRGEKCW
jgi:NAD(P)-dependent dehydrogenase (short-subunit alcohol dehydrogenase family)